MNCISGSKSNGGRSANLRSVHDYEDLSGRFRLFLRNYERQFCSIYSVRIVEVRSQIGKIVENKWGKPARRIMDLNGMKGETCVIVGTLYKNQPLKPSVLRDVSKEYQTVPPAPRTHFVSDKDELILEDETQRVMLHGELDVHSVVTGCVVAVLGKLLSSGIFVVEDYCWPETESIALPLAYVGQDKFLVLISGVELAVKKNNWFLQLFVDWVTGWSGSKQGFVDASCLVHVIFAGNCIRSKPQPKPKYGTLTDHTGDVEAVKEFDYIIQQLIECIDVDIMPGEYDPTNHTFPQQPLHKCLFPESAQYSTFRSVSNPHACRIENRLVVGSSGEPIADIQRYSNLIDSLDILERTLDWAHMAPTAPDTLPCYPFDDHDPFLLNERPHIYFAGNQSTFQSKLKKGKKYDTLLTCVPSFSQTQSFVLINLKDLTCKIICLNANKN